MVLRLAFPNSPQENNDRRIFFVRQPVCFSVPLTLAFAKGIRDLGEDGLGNFVIEMNADFALSEGSLAAVLRRIDKGSHIILQRACLWWSTGRAR
jgi:hypothetical protein